MRAVQVIIKVFALCLAGTIIISIVAALLGVVSLLGVMAGVSDSIVGEMSTVWQEDTNSRVMNLDISVGASGVRVVEAGSGSNVWIETNNKHITSWQDNNTLRVVEKSHVMFSGFFERGELVIYVPKDLKLDTVEIAAGAGMLDIDKLVANRINLSLGAGTTTINEIDALKSAKISGGAGVVEIRDGKLYDLDLDMGAGKASITAEILGNSTVESGVGRLDLTLKGSSSDYKIKIEKGIGSVTVDGMDQHDNAVYGTGSNLIELETGIGAVQVNFTKR